MLQLARIFRGHAAPIYALAVDDSFVYSASGDHFVARWNTTTGEQDAFSIHLDHVAYALNAYDDLLLIGTSDGTIHAIETLNKKQLWECNIFGSAIFALAYDTKRNGVIAGDAAGNLIVLSENGRKKLGINLNCGKIKVLQINCDQLIVGAQDGIIRIFDLETMNELDRLEVHRGTVNTLVFYNDQLISGGADGHISIMDWQTKKQLRYFPAHYQAIYGLVVRGNIAISSSMDKTLKVWDLNNWSVIQRIESTHGHKRSINALLPIDVKSVVSASDDKTLIVWQLA